MPIIEQHRSSDGLLRLLVDLTDGDWTIGFEGYTWHTHGNILSAWGYAGTPPDATRAFVDDIINSRRPIVVWRVGDKVSDACVDSELDEHENQESLRKYGSPDESFEYRYWNGAPTAG